MPKPIKNQSNTCLKLIISRNKATKTNTEITEKTMGKMCILLGIKKEWFFKRLITSAVEVSDFEIEA